MVRGRLLADIMHEIHALYRQATYHSDFRVLRKNFNRPIMWLENVIEVSLSRHRIVITKMLIYKTGENPTRTL